MNFRARHWLALVALVVAQEAVAATYYVNTSGGDDTAQGTAQASGPSGGPWRTLARASAQEYRNGDELLLHCGQTHRGRLVVRIAQGAGQLRVSGYGDCPPEQLPRIDGTVSVPTTPLNGRRSGQLPFEPGRVLLNGEMLARSFAVSRVFADSANKELTRLVPPLPPGAELGQALGYARTRDWLVEPVRFREGAWAPVSSGAKLQYPMAAGTMLAITGKAWTLGNTGWIYDNQSRQLLVAGAGDVAVAEQAPLLQVSGAGSVLVDKLQFDFAGEDAIQINIRGTAAIRGCVIKAPARRGVSVESAASLYAIDNRISGAGEDAIHVVSTPKATVMRNTVTDTATMEPMQPAFGAINVARAKTSLVAENTVERSAYVGIRFGEGAEVTSNILVDSCTLLSDCAAIYTWQKSPSQSRQTSSVSGNLIVGVYGNDEVKLGFRVWAVGIYLDDFTSNVQVTDNAVFGARQAFYFHNAFQNVLERNGSFGDHEASISVQIDSLELLPFAPRGLGNSITGQLILNSMQADALSVVRRVKVDPFRAFSIQVIGSNTDKPQITWLDNISGFEKPEFRKQDPTVASSSALNIEQSKTSISRSSQTRTWNIKRLPEDIDISSTSSHFVLSAGSGTARSGCNEIGKMVSAAINGQTRELRLLNCTVALK